MKCLRKWDSRMNLLVKFIRVFHVLLRPTFIQESFNDVSDAKEYEPFVLLVMLAASELKSFPKFAVLSIIPTKHTHRSTMVTTRHDTKVPKTTSLVSTGGN